MCISSSNSKISSTFTLKRISMADNVREMNFQHSFMWCFLSLFIFHFVQCTGRNKWKSDAFAAAFVDCNSRKPEKVWITTDTAVDWRKENISVLSLYNQSTNKIYRQKILIIHLLIKKSTWNAMFTWLCRQFSHWFPIRTQIISNWNLVQLVFSRKKIIVRSTIRTDFLCALLISTFPDWWVQIRFDFWSSSNDFRLNKRRCITLCKRMH